MFYSIYVGRCENQKDLKPIQKKLNTLGLRGYVFSLGDCYSLKVAGYPDKVKAESFCVLLKSKGFDAFIQ